MQISDKSMRKLHFARWLFLLLFAGGIFTPVVLSCHQETTITDSQDDHRPSLDTSNDHPHLMGSTFTGSEAFGVPCSDCRKIALPSISFCSASISQFADTQLYAKYARLKPPPSSVA